MNSRTIVLISAAIIVLPVAYLLLWPTEIDPQAWVPPPVPPMTGQYGPNGHLKDVERLGEDQVFGSEDSAFDSNGDLYAGSDTGKIYRIAQGQERATLFTDVQSPILGLTFDHQDNLIVCVPDRGLLSVSPAGIVTTLSTQADGLDFRFVNAADVADNGIIYFTDSSHKFPRAKVYNEFVEHRPNGRLLAYDPETKTTSVLLEDLYFPNGIVISPDQSFLLFNETTMYRVTRYWLSGSREGSTEVVVENLPGVPDGLSRGVGGVYWIAMMSPRNEALEQILPNPFLRNFIMRLPETIRPSAHPVRYGLVIGINDQGEILENLQDPEGAFFPITSAREFDGKLYLGSLSEHGVGVVPTP